MSLPADKKSIPNEKRMCRNRQIVTAVTFMLTMLGAACAPSTSSTTQETKQLVRLALIEVDTSQITAYNKFLKEEIEASIQLEPGVITLYGVAEKESPERVTLFETYADSSQYRSHLATPHFQKYKQGTLQMVTGLELIEMQPILYHRKSGLSKTAGDGQYIKLIKMEVDSSMISRFNELANTVMLPGIKNEPGILVMYAAAEKNRPTRVSILEVYESLAAYNIHTATPHYLKYKEESKAFVKSIQFIDVNPIFLGSKPQE
jgi:quinol monooxygenase YgiN